MSSAYRNTFIARTSRATCQRQGHRRHRTQRLGRAYCALCAVWLDHTIVMTPPAEGVDIDDNQLLELGELSPAGFGTETDTVLYDATQHQRGPDHDSDHADRAALPARQPGA